MAKPLVHAGGQRKAFADMMRNALYALNPLITHNGHIDRLRTVVDHIGWDAAKKIAEVRCLLQRGGSEMGRDVLGADVWINAIWPELEQPGFYIITDVRFPNEAQRIKEAGGDVWQLLRPGYGPVNDHYSEVALNGWPFDVVINNDSTIDVLHAKALAALTERFPQLTHS